VGLLRTEEAMWIVVSLTWSLLLGGLAGASWAFGEYLYNPRASYHVSYWSASFGTFVFLYFLYISYKARHKIISAGNISSDKSAKELTEFLNALRKADVFSLGTVAAQATDVASRQANSSNYSINLRYPREALRLNPRLLWELEEEVITLQKAGRQVDAPGTIVWVHTLRAEQVPELRPAVNEMWQIIGKGTGYINAAAREYSQSTGRTLEMSCDLGTAYCGFWLD
jgi:hypothetical protein